MEIRVLQTTRYRDHLIYVRRLNLETFEYLVVIRGEIYAHPFTFSPRLFQRLLHGFLFAKDVYTEKELMKAVAVVRMGATTLIDMKFDKQKKSQPVKISIKDLENGEKPKSTRSRKGKDNQSDKK